MRVGQGERFGGCLGHAGVGVTFGYTAATSSRRPKYTVGVALRGFDAAVGNATKSSDSMSCPNQVTQNPTQVPQPDAMAEFVACLTAEQPSNWRQSSWAIRGARRVRPATRSEPGWAERH